MKLLSPEAEVTNSLSNNMIKAYHISYDKEKGQKLDMSAREQRIMERIRELIPEQRFLVPFTEEKEKEGTSFVPGIAAENVSEFVAEEPQPPVMTEEEIQAMRDSVREELSMQMQQQAEAITAEAKAQAEGILAKAKEDAETAKVSILQLASAQGYEEGSKRAKQEQEQRLQELEAERLRLQQEYERRVSELEPAFVQVLTELVRKLTGVSYENHREVLIHMIDMGIHEAGKDTSFTVWLNPVDMERASDLFPELCERYAGKLALEFKEDAGISTGSCKLENAGKLIDCGLGTRLEGLLDAFDMMT